MRPRAATISPTRNEPKIEILSPYLPEQLGEDELRVRVVEAIAAAGASSPRDMGRVMSELMPTVRGRAEGKLVSSLVNEELAKAAQA